MRNQAATKQSLLADAFDILLEHLGPEKTTQLWQIFVPSKGNYLALRKKLFKGKTLASLSKEVEKFNR